MIDSPSVGDVDLYKVSQHRGQVHALDAVLDIENFMLELIKPIDGVKDENI